jgi:hypothetical protein
MCVGLDGLENLRTDVSPIVQPCRVWQITLYVWAIPMTKIGDDGAGALPKI